MAKRTQLTVVHFQRRPHHAQFSIERVFSAIRKQANPDLRYRVWVSRFRSRGFFRRLYNIIEAFFQQGDINHVTGDVHYLVYLLRANRTLLTIHDCVSLRRLAGWKHKLFRFFWYALPIRRSAMVSVVSESVKRELLNYINCPPRKIRVISSCISTEIQPAPKLFNQKRPVILQVGTGVNKNLLRVAEALSGIPCVLHVIGPIKLEQKAALDRFDVDYVSLGTVTDNELMQAYRDCDIVVFVSTYEGFGLPIVEANATGRAVVTSNILSMPEVAGDAACLVDPFDPKAINAGIMRVISDRIYREQLIERGYANAARYLPKRVAAQYAELYRELCEAA